MGLWPALASAQPEGGWEALVIPLAPQSAGLARQAADGLVGAGMAQSTVLAPEQDAIAAALDQSARKKRGVVIAVAGSMAGEGAALREGDLRRMIGASEVEGAVLLLGNCVAASTAPVAPRLHPRDEKIRLLASAAPGESCSSAPDPIFAALAQAGGLTAPVTLSQYLRAAWTDSSARAPDPQLRPMAASAPTSVQAAPSVQISAPSEDPSPIPAAYQYVPPNAADLSEIPDETLAAIPTPPDMPQPAVIIGLIGPDFAAPPADDGAIPRDLASRTALRRSNPETYRAMVAEGAFDPPAAQMAQTIQTELARMGCYRSAIDGKWGPGSRAAASAYFNERPDKVSPASLDANAALYRQIILAPDLACPAPKTTIRQERPRTTTTATRSTAPAQQPAQQEATPTINRMRMMNGAFR